MLFSYMIARVLLVLASVFGRLPRSAGKAFARALNAATVPFDRVNYVSPCGAVKVFGPRRTGAAFDRVIDSLQRRLAAQSDADLAAACTTPSAGTRSSRTS